ncbi:hypothetical protein MAR_035140, partial [Mya arenaria]
MLWFPGGPPLTFLPFPMPDGDRRPGSCPDHECCGGHFLPPSEVIEKRLKVNIWLEHLNNVAANRERGQAKAAETRSLKKKELRTETTPGGAATSTATTHRSSARSPNHSQAQSAPDNIMVDVSRFGRRRFEHDLDSSRFVEDRPGTGKLQKYQ